MFGLVVAISALAAAVSGPGLSDRVASSLGDDVLETDLVGLWYWAFVSPTGTIEKCNVVAAVGDAKAARKVCDKIVGQKVRPALGMQGQPTYGAFVGSISLAENLERMPAGSIPPDLTIRTNGGQDGQVALNVAIGADGKVLGCEPSGGVDQLSRRACDEVSRLDFAVETAKDGQAVGYLRAMTVQFEQERG